MQDFISKRIKSLPPLNESTLEIQRICNDENSSLKDLAKIVEKDPMLTANILKSANSPLYGFSREISSVDRAVNLFGMTTIKGFALNAAVKNSFKINLSAYNMNEAMFAKISTMQNSLAINWLNRSADNTKKVVIPASFLLEIGKIVISSELVETNKAEEFRNGLSDLRNIKELSDYEKQFLGMSSEEVTSMIFDKWNLEVDMIDAIFYSVNPENASNDIKKNAIALNIVSNLINIFGFFNEEMMVQCVLDAKNNGLLGDKLIDAIKVVEQDA
ncbi:HDOD domain-containing protein [Campylobacter sp. 2018MI13]|uniref:HDOD domain-containing protein n=1 Tax=Campylobacter sp. 2018MI13 TaxID=2836737 RepID=UPI001BDA773A|nr:HDOD domain-containing protein [Campylobacter sp. 2018MI13]MBT0882532.1 HDOD domain-containing protein [Campylobacter sp. 2018MI13]